MTKHFNQILSISLIAFLLTLVPQVPALAEEEKSSRKSSVDLPTIDPYSEEEPQVQVVADNLQYLREEKKIIAKGNVVIEYLEYKITSDYAEVFTESRKAIAKGHMIIFHGNEIKAEGDEIYFDFRNSQGEFPDGRHFTPPWFITGEEIKQVKDGEIQITNAIITTCDREDHPHYGIHASHARILKDDKLIARNVRIYALEAPIFWLPYLVLPLNLNSLPFSIAAGHNSQDGYYVELTKGFVVSSQMNGKLLADWRSKRGFGGGAILDYDFGEVARGNLIGYWTQDDNAPTLNNADNPFEEDQSRDRGRLTWRHRADINDYSYVVMRYHRVADEFVLQDFFEKEFRSVLQQQSFATMTLNGDRQGLLIHGQKRMNNFEALVERLPEVRHTWKNQEFFVKGLYYESESSVANLYKKFGRTPLNEDVVRIHSSHHWFRPFKLNDYKFTPFLNVQGTGYSRERFSDDDRFRFALGYGFDLRKQFYKTYNQTSDFAGIEINGLRHIIEPNFQMESIHPSTVSDETINHFDRIDLVDDKDVFTLGVENRIQTKRVVAGKMQRVDIVSLNTYVRFDINPDEPSPDTGFKTLNQEITLRPYDWLKYDADITIDLENGRFAVFNQDITLEKQRWDLLLGHRYVNNSTFQDARFIGDFNDIDASHQLVFAGNYRLNELWEFNGHIRWDLDENELEEWQLGATRDLHDFIFSFGYNVRNSSIRNSNSEIYFNFSMKDFSALALRSGGGRATFSEPRIGETVAGANQYGGRAHRFDPAIRTY